MVDLDILVVDDEPLIADNLTRILALNGYSARSFTNPYDALAAIQHGCPSSPWCKCPIFVFAVGGL